MVWWFGFGGREGAWMIDAGLGNIDLRIMKEFWTIDGRGQKIHICRHDVGKDLFA